jgi:hypothetical protein
VRTVFALYWRETTKQRPCRGASLRGPTEAMACGADSP